MCSRSLSTHHQDQSNLSVCDTAARRNKERPPQAAKRRGRPPKVVAAAAPAAAANTIAAAAGGSPVKRPRGRPRKVPAAADRSNGGSQLPAGAQPELARRLAKELDDELNELIAARTARSAAARSRSASPAGASGRKRASASPPAKDGGAAAGRAARRAAAVLLPDTSPKRGRGRPRKAEADAAADTSPKRGRGRPKKVLSDSGGSDSTLAALPAATADSPIVLLSDSESEPGPASRSADSIPLPDSPSLASCIDLESDAESGAVFSEPAALAVAAPRHRSAADAEMPAQSADSFDAAQQWRQQIARAVQRTAQPPTQPVALHSQQRQTDQPHLGAAQQAMEPDEAVPMCTPQPLRRAAGRASLGLHSPVGGATAMQDAALTTMLCSPPMASPPGHDSSPEASETWGSRRRTGRIRQEKVISLLT